MASWQPRMRAAVGLVLASTLLTAIALEIGLRLVGWEPQLQSQWMLGDRHLVLDPDVIIIPERLLDPAFYTEPATPLVLALGDSFTQGFPVPAARSYPAVLERVLARRGIAATVRNAGMGDSGPDQQLRLLTTRLLPELQPAVVVWQLYVNDVWDNVTKAVYRLDGDRLVPVRADRHWITLRQRVFDWTPLPKSVKKRSRLFQLVLGAVERGTRPAPEDDPVAGSLAKLARELDEFARLAVVHDFVPYLLLVPPQSLCLAKREPDRWQDHWSHVEHQRLAALLRGRPGFVDGDLGDAASDDDFADGEHDPQPRGVRHYSERGYARLAVLVARRVVHDRALVRDRELRNASEICHSRKSWLTTSIRR